MESTNDYIKRRFGVDEQKFIEAIKMSPGDEGYILGSLSELLLKDYIESIEFEVYRIKEKWEGAKHANHHGDFYFKRENEPWRFVLESKGVKSNSEKWHKLYNYKDLIRFLCKHNDKISWIENDTPIETQVKDWVDRELPEFQENYLSTLYGFEEIKKYETPERETGKSIAIEALKGLSREEISALIDERLSYVMNKVKVLETHFVSSTSEANHRNQATPRIDEFNLISIDIFLRYIGHEFVFANPKDLEASSADNNHLQQNYIMGFVFNNNELSLSEEWHRDFNCAYDTLNNDDSISEEDMQIDNRN